MEEEEEEERQEVGAQWKKEIEAIQRAMDEENSRVESAQSRQMSKGEADECNHSPGKSISYSCPKYPAPV